MENKFEKANTGDLFKTRDGRIAKYDHWFVDGGKKYYYFTTVSSGFFTDETGKSTGRCDDIVGEYDGNVGLV